MEKLTRTEKIGTHLAIIALAMVARDHNKRGEKWFNRFLSKIYLGLEVVELICLANDLRREE